MAENNLSQIKNFGPRMVQIFEQIGVHSKKELIELSYREIRDKLIASGIKPHLLIFYSIEMGLQDRSWMDITPGEKAEIKGLLKTEI